MKRALKYRNHPVLICMECGGAPSNPKACDICGAAEVRRFASKAEAKRYGELEILEHIGQIENLVLQPRYPLRHQLSGADVGTYVADFEYRDSGKRIAEDVKGVQTAVFKLKAKLFAACYPHIELRIIRA